MIKIASLFSGIGGFEKGILKAIPDAKIVFSSEIDKYARQIYKKNYGVEPHGDITKIKASSIPDHDILCGGFPCQDVSIAGKRKGLCGARTGLFFDIIRILHEKQPRIVFLENVKGLLSSNNGWDFARILIELEDAGYECEWQVLNTKAFLPQNRERVFIIGHLTEPGRSGSKIFPIGESGNVATKKEPTVYTLDANYYKGPAKQSRTMIQQVNSPIHSQNRIYSKEGISPCLNSTDGGNQQPFILCDSGPGRKDQLRDQTIPPLRANTGAGHNNIVCHSTLPRSSVSGKGGTGHLKRDDELSYCCDAANNIAVEINQQIRRLTPIECERLQGFPQLESYININIHNNTICLDLQKSFVNVETKNHKSQKHAGIVEKSEAKEVVSYAEKNLNIKNQPINKPVQKNVLINCVEGIVEIHNHKKSYSFVNYVESQNLYLQHIKTEDFAHLLAGINITLENAMLSGKEVSHQNDQYSIRVQNGKLFVKLYGREIMQPATDAKNDLITLKKHLKYITLNQLDLKKIDYN